MLDPDAVREALAEDAEELLPLLARMSRATDPGLRRQVLALAPRLVVERAASGAGRRSGTGRLQAAPVRYGGDLDVDASLDAVLAASAERRPVDLDDLLGRSWRRPAWAVCLLVDRSGSMDGARLATAAMAAAACTLRVEGELAVVAFDRRAEVVAPLAAPQPADRTVARVLALRGHGMTSLHAAFRAAGEQLARARARRRVTIVLSDCRATDDMDPLPAARALEELVVIAPAADADEARQLAHRTGARFAPIGSLDDLPRIVDDLLGRTAPA
ncbi:MAG: vWA domain-containing protein [Marmoricola sp.]